MVSNGSDFYEWYDLRNQRSLIIILSLSEGVGWSCNLQVTGVVINYYITEISLLLFFVTQYFLGRHQNILISSFSFLPTQSKIHKMTKGKKAQKHTNSTVTKNIETNAEKPKEDDDRHVPHVKKSTDEISKKPVVSAIKKATSPHDDVSKSTALNSPLNAESKVSDDNRKQIKFIVEKQDTKEFIADKSKEENVVQGKNRESNNEKEILKLKNDITTKSTDSEIQIANDGKVSRNSKQNVEEQVPVSIAVQQDSNVQNEIGQKVEDQNRKEPPNNKPQGSATNLSTEKEDNIKTKSEKEKSNDIKVDTEQKTEIAVVDVKSEDGPQQKSEETDVDQSKLVKNAEEKEILNQEKTLNADKNEKKNVTKNEAGDKSKINTNKKEQKCNEDHKAAKKTDTEHMKEGGSKNEHKKKQDSKSKDTVKVSQADVSIWCIVLLFTIFSVFVILTYYTYILNEIIKIN